MLEHNHVDQVQVTWQVPGWTAWRLSGGQRGSSGRVSAKYTAVRCNIHRHIITLYTQYTQHSHSNMSHCYRHVL